MDSIFQYKYKRSNSTGAFLPDENNTVAPDLKISLDLPTCSDYIPVYWPGQDVTGRLSINVEDPVEVLYLRVALFGHCQVYDQPGHPLIHGMFDYLENKQFLNTGFRITRRPNEISSGSDDNSAADAGCPTGEQQQQQQQQHCNAKSAHSPKTKKNKSRLDKSVERLIHDVASSETEAGAHKSNLSKFRATLINAGKDAPFMLPSNKHHIQFSLRVPNTRNLPGTFDHHHFPIQYRLVAIMLCKHIQSGIEMTTYNTVLFKLEPHVNIASDLRFASPLQTNWASCWVGNTSWWGASWPMFTSKWRISRSWINHTEDNESVDDKQRCIRTMWLDRLFQGTRSSWWRLGSGRDRPCGYLRCAARLPRQAFVRGQTIPLRVDLINDANIPLAAVSVHVALVRKILMTSHLGEPVESTVMFETNPVFWEGREETFRSKKMHFDLADTLYVPENCTCTVSSEATRDTIEILHEIQVKVYVLETTAKDDSTVENQTEESFYQPAKDANDQDLQVTADNSRNQYRLYTLIHSPLSVVIGNIN
ncbi:hypothetical protein DFQ28_010271 [Apophysomyces sp. BC1034]|nr:hypothetical protein DFQ30_009890 [Apophysomyces sp. BC1015]KAG0171566.1 hypothetical protein DFQ29_008776 [Apophysomyces sp. BC1021]KAG0184901.1 hypothetical protein DFQ28_010271 [Apophysomyces sp. BC1034]